LKVSKHILHIHFGLIMATNPGSIPVETHQPSLLCVAKDPKPEKHDEAKAIDIVAVHGLRPAANIDAWKIADGSLWLKKLLPRDVKGVRVFTFSYNALAVFSGADHKLTDAAMDMLLKITAARAQVPLDRPLVFICHGFGSFVVECVCSRAFQIYSMAGKKTNLQ
jgi:hypothetical protein